MFNAIHVWWQIIVGVLLGVFYFGGLWLTVSKLSSFKQPAAWVSLSSLFRTAGVIGGFYIVSHFVFLDTAFSLLGFILARTILTKAASRTYSNADPKSDSKADL